MLEKITQESFLCCLPFLTISPEEIIPQTHYEDSFIVENNESIPKQEWPRDLDQADENTSAQLAWFSQVLNCPPHLPGAHPMVTSLFDWNEMIILPMKDGDGTKTFQLRLIVTHGIQMPK
ncbi:hypothetical protein O181_026935 [Austropuccinia psidii MF-1]|uniref:Uncharacterized protein n=1 Tax=Austropuccinia psidii MF-1 TaxID=1389203 RepID=A0A9Q3CQD1_9BASI|nr:hypothetical protein [Austropuccinia psidii MF-1]